MHENPWLGGLEGPQVNLCKIHILLSRKYIVTIAYLN